MKRSAATIDPITANVIGGALETIAVEMGLKLMRMSHSSLIRESEDFGAAVMDAAGNQIAETPQSTPLQSGPLPGYVRGIRAALERRGEAIEPGDVYIHNDAYGGASHVPDVAFCVPVFHEGALVGFTGTAAHHVDIGAHTPGSAGIVDAVDAYAEGIQLKGLKIYDKGVKNTTLWAVLADNIRASHLVLGDMEAQIAAARIGAEAFLRLIDRYGLATVQAACTALMDYSERMMRQSIEALPDGRYCAEGAIDGFLDDDDPARRELPIAVAVTVSGSEITVDFTGTAAQVDDRPINMPLRGTVDCAVWMTLRSILLDSAVHGRIPLNAGLTRPIHLVAPKGTLVNPTFPAPTIARACPGIQCADTIMKALAQAVPDQISAGVSNLNVVAYSGLRGERHWVHMEIYEGAYGGRAARTAWTRWTSSSPTRGTTRSRMSNLTFPCASTATSYARRAARRGVGGAGSDRSAKPSCSTMPASRSRARASASRPGAMTAAMKAERTASPWSAPMAQRKRCRPSSPI